MRLFVFILTVFMFSASTYGSSTGEVSVSEFWSGPGNYDRIFIDGDISGLGGNCSYTDKFAIKTDDPNYKTMTAIILAALMSGKRIKLYGPGTECLDGEKYPVANRVTIVAN